MKTELVVINPKEYGLEEKQAEKMTSGLAVVLTERKALEQIYNAVIAKELNAETFKEARELRLKVQKNRTTGIEAWHKANKAFYLAGGRFVDAYKNKEVIINEQMEERLLEIEKYEEKLAADLKSKLKAERLALLEPFEVDTQFVSIEEMTEEQFNGFLFISKLSFETKKEQEKQAELARIEAEKKADAERLEAERLEKERLEAQRVENERLKAEAEAREKALAEKEVTRRKRFAEMQPMAIMFRDFNGVIELPEKEYQKQLSEHKIAYKQHLEFQLEKENKAREEAEKIRQKELAEIEANAKIKAEENAKKELQEQEKARIEAEEAEKLAKEKALLLAPDKDKVKVFFGKFTALEFPDLESEAGKAMSVRVKEALAMVKQLIINDSKTLL